MRIIHLCNAHWGAGRATGVPRFSRYFQQAFPGAIQATPGDLRRIRPRAGDVVVADNHLSLEVPWDVRTVVVHHGCAQTHYDRDPSWQSADSRRLCELQREMFRRPNRSFVAPSRWVAEQFAGVTAAINVAYTPKVIPHWVPLIDRPARPIAARPVVIGDWRDPNKGRDHIGRIREALPQYEFRQIDFPPGDDRAREACYRDADIYLCLSASEGAPYSVADAEAASLPIITTEVGNCREFGQWFIGSRIRDQPQDQRPLAHAVYLAMGRACVYGRCSFPSFFEAWTFERWREAWQEVLLEARRKVQEP